MPNRARLLSGNAATRTIRGDHNAVRHAMTRAIVRCSDAFRGAP
jgi:ribosomal protein S9